MGKMKTRLVLVLAFITALEGKNYLIETGDLETSKEGLNYMSEAEAGEDVPCVDNSKHCPVWSKTGECEKNPDYMLVNCRKSCKVCTVDGNWNFWGSWSSCDALSGKRRRTRHCNDPAPKNGGSQCLGSSRLEEDCPEKTMTNGPDADDKD